MNGGGAGRVRVAGVGDREAMLAVINEAFGRAGQERRDFLRDMPYLFHNGRMSNHVLYEVAGRIVGVVGQYPYPLRMGPVTFATGGVGQVCTLPEARGRRAMSALLEAQNRAAAGLDFTWLYGDRQRYGRFGYASGGGMYVFETWDKYVPEAPGVRERVRAFEVGRDWGLLEPALEAAPTMAVVPEEELRMLLAAKHIGGWVLGEAMMLVNGPGDTVLLGHGSEQALTGLLGFLVRHVRTLPGDHWKVAVRCGPEATSLLRVCQRYEWTMRMETPLRVRIGNLRTFFEKAVAWANALNGVGAVGAAGAGGGSGGRGAGERLTLVNGEDGQTVTLTAAGGVLGVEASVEAEGDAYRLTTEELSELIFGLAPAEALLPGLRRGSAFRQILPFPMHVPPWLEL